MNVQPKNKLTTKIAVVFLCPLPKAINHGKKYNNPAHKTKKLTIYFSFLLNKKPPTELAVGYFQGHNPNDSVGFGEPVV